MRGENIVEGWKYRNDIFTPEWRYRVGENIVSHRRIRNQQICVSGKMPMSQWWPNAISHDIHLQRI